MDSVVVDALTLDLHDLYWNEIISFLYCCYIATQLLAETKTVFEVECDSDTIIVIGGGEEGVGIIMLIH